MREHTVSLITASLVGNTQFAFRLMAPDSNSRVIEATLLIEAKGNEVFVTLTASDSDEWSIDRQRAPSVYVMNEKPLYWPRELKKRSGERVEMRMDDTASTFAGSNTRISFTTGGDHVVAGMVENNEEVVAVGICRKVQKADP